MGDPLLSESTAYHEAGHIVVAAALGLRLSRFGIRIDCEGFGIAFFDHRKPVEDCNLGCLATHEQTVIAVMAGFFAQRTFYVLRGDHAPESLAGCRAGDDKLISELLPENPLDRTELEKESERLVIKHWLVIADIAKTLWAAQYMIRDFCELRINWSTSEKEKTLDGYKLQDILKRFEIQARVWDHRAWQPIKN